MAKLSAKLEALFDQAHRLRRDGDVAGARQAYQQVIDSGHSNWADEASFMLGSMLEDEGDWPGAREQFQRLVEAGHERWGPIALDNLVVQLQRDGDLDGLRALHRTAADTRNSSAPDALVAIGQLLERRGDADDARLAYQQAIDAGYAFADDLIEKLHPTPPPTEAELDQLPPQVDPRNILRTGIEVLSDGVPKLPAQLSYLMAIPVAYWTAQQNAVVLLLRFKPHGRRHRPMVWHVTYARTETGWTAHRRFGATGFSHDPIAEPRSRRDLGGQKMVTGGGAQARQAAPGRLAIVRHGRAGRAVKYLALIQDGREDLRRLESHFGVWVICTDELSPIQIEGRDANRNVLDRITFQPRDWTG